MLRTTPEMIRPVFSRQLAVHVDPLPQTEPITIMFREQPPINVVYLVGVDGTDG